MSEIFFLLVGICIGFCFALLFFIGKVFDRVIENYIGKEELKRAKSAIKNLKR
jgi:type III secretory pathway component EscT